MKYIDYINYLKSNNIILFDHDYRISYHNINKYATNNNQHGGGYNNIDKLTNMINMINIALSSNPHYLSFY